MQSDGEGVDGYKFSCESVEEGEGFVEGPLVLFRSGGVGIGFGPLLRLCA